MSVNEKGQKWRSGGVAPAAGGIGAGSSGTIFAPLPPGTWI